MPTRQPALLKTFPLVVGSIAVHTLLLVLLPLWGEVSPMADVSLYGWWLDTTPGFELLGISRDWVYPFPALIPMFFAKVLGLVLAGGNVLTGWILLLIVIDTMAILTLVQFGRTDRQRLIAAWFWLAFIFLLGPVAIARIDAVATAVALFGVLALSAGRIRSAVILFTFGAWIKIWPIATALAVFVADRARKMIVLLGIATSATILVVGWVLGGDASMFSFFTMQGNRGIQVEAPIATIWLWASKLGVPDTYIYFDQVMLTNQIHGQNVELIASLMNPAMLVAFLITAWLAVRAYRAGVDRNSIFAATALTAVLDLIVFNKVGSPQFQGWLAVPIIAFIIFKQHGWRFAIITGLVLASLTNLIYPVFYLDLMGMGWTSIGLLTVRNLLLIGFLVWANIKLSGLSKSKPAEVAISR